MMLAYGFFQIFYKSLSVLPFLVIQDRLSSRQCERKGGQGCYFRSKRTKGIIRAQKTFIIAGNGSAYSERKIQFENKSNHL